MVVDDAHLPLRWRAVLTRDPNGAPLVPPFFVAEQGAAVQIVDVRSPDEATGVLGYIPGSAFVPESEAEALARDDSKPPLVLVSAAGEEAAQLARRFEGRGAHDVAAMAGGIAAWRAAGLATTRDPAGLRDSIPAAPRKNGPLTISRVREHIGDPRTVRWIKLASMVAQGTLSCIDGRDDRGVIGTPGGDGGEFLLTLAAIEKTTGKTVEADEVERALLAHLDAFGPFYLHTDLLAVEALMRAVGEDPRLQRATADLSGPEEWSAFLRRPATGLRDALLEQLVKPEHIGCGHIRLMLENGGEYGVRPELVRSFLQAVHRLYWQGAPELRLTALPGEHSEAGILNVRLAEPLWELSRIPLISPTCGGNQMFIHHADVAATLRRTTARSFTRGGGPLQVDRALEERLETVQAELAAQQLACTARHLADGLPVFDVLFAGDGAFEVLEPAGA